MKHLVWLFVCLLCSPAFAQDAVMKTSVDTGKTLQVMQGFGSSQAKLSRPFVITVPARSITTFVSSQ